jgi:hypothetical protein
VKGDPQDYRRRENSDFLLPTNHEGEILDFRALRHTCGAWLATFGAFPKVVQQVMRHSNISLTMDTYGHLFPGEEAAAVGRLERVFGTGSVSEAPTGTENLTAEARSARRSARDAAGCLMGAIQCNEEPELHEQKHARNTLNSAARCNPMQSSTMLCDAYAPLAQLAEQLTLNQ